MARNTETTYRKATLPEGKKEQLINDGDNLYMRLRSTKSGEQKSWQFNYHHPLTKKRIKLSIGDYPSLSLKDARKKALEYHELLTKNVDPKDWERKGGVEALDVSKITFRDVAEMWLTEIVDRESEESIKDKIEKAHERARKNGLKKATDHEINDITKDKHNRTPATIRGRLKNHLYPAIGDMSITTLKAHELRAGLKPSIDLGINMSKIIGIAKNVMKFAKNEGYIESNPFVDIADNFKDKKAKKQATIRPERLNELMQAIGNSTVKMITRCAFEMQLHILSRPGENARLRWDEVDLETGLITIPGYKMKREKDFLIPLTKYTRGLLEHMKPISFNRSEYVFPAVGSSSKPHIDSQSVNKALRDNGMKGEIVSHGFRSVGSTYLNEATEGTRRKFDNDVIEACLAHSDSNKIRDIYNNAEYLELRKNALEQWGDFIVNQAGNNFCISSRYK